MTKKEIVKTISEGLKLTQLKTKEIVQMTFEAIVETLVNEGRIELRNFGVFEVKRRAPRKARNPRTSESVLVPEKYVVTFKPGKVMEDRVQEKMAQKQKQKGKKRKATAKDGQASEKRAADGTRFATLGSGGSGRNGKEE